MAEPDKKDDQILIKEAQDGSATVEVSDDMLNFEEETNPVISTQQNSDENKTIDEDADHPDDDDDLRSAKRNRRRAKKDLIRKTNQEKDVRLQQLQRENEQFKQRLNQLERNTKAEHITRLDKGIEDAQVRLEYAKMKLSEATQNNDGQAMVEAQELWQTANEEARRLNSMKAQANRELNRPPSPQIDPEVQRQAAQWMSRNKWYNPAATDADSRVAKKIDELMIEQGLNPSDPDYWDELDSRLQRELPHRYNDNTDDNREIRRPRNVVGSSGREASAAYGGTNRTQFVLDAQRVRAMKEAGAWDNPDRKARMIKQFIAYDRQNGRHN